MTVEFNFKDFTKLAESFAELENNDLMKITDNPPKFDSLNQKEKQVYATYITVVAVNFFKLLKNQVADQSIEQFFAEGQTCFEKLCARLKPLADLTNTQNTNSVAITTAVKMAVTFSKYKTIKQVYNNQNDITGELSPTIDSIINSIRESFDISEPEGKYPQNPSDAKLNPSSNKGEDEDGESKVSLVKRLKGNPEVALVAVLQKSEEKMPAVEMEDVD